MSATTDTRSWENVAEQVCMCVCVYVPRPNHATAVPNRLRTERPCAVLRNTYGFKDAKMRRIDLKTF